MTEANLAEAETDGALPEGSDAEAKARRLGWVSKEEFKGDPDKHRSAEEFLQRGETILPILQRDNKKLHDTVSRFEKELRETKEAAAGVEDLVRKSAEREHKKALRDLERRLDAAIETADVTQARQIRAEISELQGGEPAPKREPKPVGEPDKPAVDPEIQSWIDQNDWFNKSVALRGYATEVYGDLEKQFPGKSRSELLSETKQRTVDRFPEKFGVNPKRDGAAAVAAPGGVASTKKPAGRTYDDLPAEAKRACDKFVKNIPGYTKEKYVKDYEWD
jgi:hypothetical protein